MARTVGDCEHAEAVLKIAGKLGFWIETIGNHSEVVFSGPKRKKMRVDATQCEIEMWKLLVENYHEH